MAYSNAASRAEYSAKLLVRCPRYSLSCAMGLPRASRIYTPNPAGPGFPRAPPSTLATIQPSGAGDFCAWAAADPAGASGNKDGVPGPKGSLGGMKRVYVEIQLLSF